MINKIIKDETNKNCIKIFIKTHCNKCGKTYPINFLNNNKLFELIDINKNIEYWKYIYQYIKLDKNKNKENNSLTFKKYI